MKRKTFSKIFTILVIASILIAACTKEPSEVKYDPKLSTSQVLNIKADSATVVGFIVAAGNGFTEKGICYDIATGPTTASNKVVYDGTSKTATFSVKIGGLSRLTTYYARAYGINSSGTIYGDEITFKTIAVIPTIASIAVPTLTSTPDKGVKAVTAINITDDGGPDPTANITKRGVVYALFAHPTIDSTKSKLDANKTIATSEGTGKGAFNSTALNLSGHVKYYLRAYATNKMGTAYSNEVSFTTPVSYPTVTTTAATNVAASTATSGGVVTNDGGGTITERGVCWSTSANPTTADSKTSDGTGKGTFISSITGLSLSTTYHVRAYAVNSAGTGYGADLQFSTYPSALYMVGSGVISDAAHQWDWTVDLPMIPVNSHSNLFWKIVWMEATGGFKINSAKAWDGNQFGKTGSATGGVWDKGGDDIPVPGTAGYYMVVVDLATNKIAVADPKVYLIGNTVGSWDTANASALFTVDNLNSVVTITKTLAADEIRMYAWHPWFTDWWQSEFIILGGKIEFRGTGGDQTRVTVTAGSNKVDLNFKTGDGAITLIP